MTARCVAHLGHRLDDGDQGPATSEGIWTPLYSLHTHSLNVDLRKRKIGTAGDP